MKKILGFILFITIVSATYFLIFDKGRILDIPEEIPPNYSEIVAAETYKLWLEKDNILDFEEKLKLSFQDKENLKYLPYDNFENGGSEYLNKANDILDMVLPYANFTMSYSLNYYQLLGAKYCNSIENTVTLNNYNEFINVQAKVQQVANEIESKAQNDLEKVTALNKYLIENVQYDTSFGKNLPEGDKRIWEAWGALNDGKAVCSGYVNAFSLICKEMDIPVVSVVGYRDRQNPNDVNEIGHEWNEVFVNGNWSAVDVTSNDPIIQGGYMSDVEKYRKYGKKHLFVNQDFLIQNKYEWNQENLDAAKRIAYPDSH